MRITPWQGATLPKLKMWNRVMEVPDELVLCTERRPSALQPHQMLYHYPQGHEKNILFCTSDVLPPTEPCSVHCLVLATL